MPDTVVPSNLRLIGGEMLVWADDDATAGRVAAHGRLLGTLAERACRALPGARRVLVAGPHSVELVARLAATGVKITCLVRAYADGAAVARRLPDARVLCGSLAKLDADEQFDAVVALDGLHRLSSVEGADLTWGESLERLIGALAPDGRLVLGLDNLLGVHRLVEMTPWYADETDAAWSPVGEYDESRPRSLHQLGERLGRAGLRVAASYAGYPLPGAPSVLVGAGGAADDAALRGFLDGTISAALGDAYAGTPVLSDPRRLATSALHGGLGAALAPGWVVVGDRGGLPPAELPEVLVADAAAGGDWGVEYAVTGAGGSWTRRLLDDGEPAVRAAGRVRREPGRLVGPVPAGRTLEELLLAGCLGRDLPQLRRLLGEYATWLTARCDPDGRLPGEFAFATPRHTIVNGTSFAVLDPSWTVAVPVPYEVGLARALRAFAVTLIGDGYSHPWPASSDADSLTVILAGMAGHAIERTVARQAVDLEAELQGAVRGWDDDTRAEFAARLAAVDAGTLPPDVDSHRKLHQSVLRLRQELEHTEAKLAWYEELLTSRENALKRTQRTVDMLSGSLSYRVGRLLMAPVRVAKRVARGAYRRLRSR